MCKPRVLVVDDEVNIRFALKRWFEANGFDVDVADDGDVAIDLCGNNDYDVVTMDLEMPRVNGRDAAAAIREMHPQLPVIVLTGYFPQAPDSSLENVTKVLIKPLSLHVLEDEVRKAIGM